MGTKTEKPLVFFTKTENQMLKNKNPPTALNTKTEVFWHKNRKTDQKNIQNRKTENPNAPHYFQGDREPSSELGKKQRKVICVTE